MARKVYRREDREQAMASDFCCGDIVAVGKSYNTLYGERWVCITEDDIKQLKAGKMLYTNDGEYATCIVYKGEKK